MISCKISQNMNTKVPGEFTTGVVAHRGAFKKNNLPENSIAGLQEAIRLQCEGSEFDIRVTADDSLVIIHDPVHAGINVEETKYNELVLHKLSNGETLPTLREYLLAGMHQNQTKLVLEVKPSGVSKQRSLLAAEKSFELVQELGIEEKVIYISFDFDVIKKILSLNPQASVQYLNGDKSPMELKKDGVNGIDYNLAVFRMHPSWIESAKQNNIVLNAWTVNKATDMDWLLRRGFDYITTDEPELLAKRIRIMKIEAANKP
ncbi:MAG: glycerophosphodiester phosphodiesterase [Chitinophagaceae bacterium]|nr:glycerophosphodiester phosphodiesterase [Chitinophagaceae bacterium]